ncbi:GNAT family N-acetyltransferase, partial [Cronobacter dublinensis]|uniref:GNAT family N-acetyltransferase n=1 Tax=Cronobacter dublinensis TaxID=413497 RepID=UPI001F3F4854
YLGYSLGEKWQGQGLMFEALTSAIRYMQRSQHMHRIMANYMPHNQRSYLGYSLGEKWQGQGLMFEALTSAIRYMQRSQH